MNVKFPLPCPACGSSEATPHKRLRFEAIWRAYETELGVRIDPSLRWGHTPPNGLTTLYRCARCTLDFFSPVIPASEEFYSTLSEAQVYYETERWEYSIVRERLSPGDAVADFGTGDGAFLRMIASRVSSVAGVDSNPAINGIPEANAIVHAGGFRDFAAAHAGSFDAVCAFHVLEHVTDAAHLIEPMLQALRRGGRVFISVPNRDRDRMPGLEPMDAPPHHVSRWNAGGIRGVADRYGLSLTALDQEPFFGDATVRREFHRKLPAPLVPAAAKAYEVARAAAVMAVRARNRDWRSPRDFRGHALLAEFTYEG